MGDIADQSDRGIAQAINSAVEKARQSHGLRANGRCHFCDEPTAPTAVFCNTDCRDDYEQEQAALKRAGRS